MGHTTAPSTTLDIRSYKMPCLLPAWLLLAPRARSWKSLDCFVDCSASQTPSRKSWPLSGSLPRTSGLVRVPVGVPFAVSWLVSPSASCTVSFVSPGPSYLRSRCPSSRCVLLLVRRHRLHLVCRPPVSVPSFANLVVVACLCALSSLAQPTRSIILRHLHLLRDHCPPIPPLPTPGSQNLTASSALAAIAKPARTLAKYIIPDCPVVHAT